MATQAPDWLTPPQAKWIDCSVEGFLAPDEYAVQIQVNGHGVAAVIQKDFVKPPAHLPNVGKVRVVVVANLPDNHVLADLPSSPLNGTRRISVAVTRLAD